MNEFDYVIIGNSAGAIGCIEGIRSVDNTGTIALVSEEAHHVYSRALIPYFLSGATGTSGMAFRPPDFYERAGVRLFLNKKAVKINFGDKEVVLDDGNKLGYGKLLLATGGKPVFPPIPGLRKKNVFSFHSIKDALGIKQHMAGARNAVVLGGGVIGLMAAEVLLKKNIKVCVLELADRVLAPVVDVTASRMVEETFREAGVEVLTNNTVAAVHGKEYVEKVTLQDGRTIPCDLLIVGIGVTPRVELAEETELEVDRGIVVNEQMQTSVSDVYACGDCISVYNFVTGLKQPLPLWPNAYLGGRIAGVNMAGKTREYTTGTSMNAMHFFDLNLINAGVNATADGDADWHVVSKLDPEKKIYRKFTIDRDGVLRGFILIGQVARAGILLNLMRKKIDVRGFQQELLRDNFGYADLPDLIRWHLLKEHMILGVV